MDSEVGALVEKAGRMMEFWQEYQRKTADRLDLEWSDEEYQQRKRIVLDAIGRMETALNSRGEVMEQYGWTLTDHCEWQRIALPEEEKEVATTVEDPSLLALEGSEEIAPSPWR